MRRLTILACAVLLASLGLAVFGFGQSTSARLQGTVKDVQGAVIPGATVTVTSIETSRVNSIQSNEAGVFSVLALPPGRYRIEVKQANFRTIVQEVTLQVQQVAELNFVLQPGAVQETVEVTSDVPLVEGASSNMSEVIQGRQIVELPLNGRNFTALATLVPGVTRGVPDGQQTGAGNQAETFRYNYNGGSALSVNGLRPQANNFLLDGVDNNESLVNTVIFFPPTEAIQEFRVDTNVAPAEFGRAGGGVVNTSYKSGSNQYHGSAFYSGRNDNLDAKPYFMPATQNKPEFKRHQFGGTFGGAIVKNKLFVFGDYQGLRQYLPFDPERATVPTMKMRDGDFSELLTLSSPIAIKNPDTGTALAGNLIPSSMIIAAGQNYLKAFPQPNLTGSDTLCGQANAQGVCILQNYLAQRTQIQQWDDFDIRTDYNVTSRDVLFGRYSYGKEKSVTSARLPTLPSGYGSGTQFNDPRSIVLGYTHIFSPAVINEFRAGWVRTKFGYEPPFQNEKVSADLGIPNANTSPLLGGGALIGGWNNQLEYTGDYGPYLVPQNTFQYSDALSWSKGNHNFKFGFNIIRRQVNLFRPFAGKGYFFLFGNGGGQSPTGYEVSDVLAGWVDRYDVGPAFGMVGTRNWETGYYAQDDWRINRRLTVNLGIRYDLYTWPTEVKDRQANFDLETGKIVLPTGGTPSFVPTDRNNIAPRIGFAYDVTGNGKTVLRGGYGIFYFVDRGGIDNQLAQNPPFSGQSSFNYSNGYRINLGGQAPLNATDPTQSGSVAMPQKDSLPIDINNPTNVRVIAYLPSNVNSYVQQWNLQVQREVGANNAVTLAYVGTKGTHLATYYNLNRQEYAAAAGVKPFPLMGNIDVHDTNGGSIYHGLQAGFQRRMTKGLQVNANYTWSHAIDDSPGAFDNQTDRVDITNFAHERANSNLDVRHRFVLSSLYELPFGKGRMFGSSWNGVVDAILGGWQVSPIVTLQSGMPFDLISGYGNPRTRPDLVGTLKQIGNNSQWFDTTAFVDPPKGAGGVYLHPGTAPRNPFTGPNTKVVDTSIAKTFSVTEKVKTEFRGEFFNLFNTPQFAQPNGDISSGDFGKVKSTRFNSQRQVQLGLRVWF